MENQPTKLPAFDPLCIGACSVRPPTTYGIAQSSKVHVRYEYVIHTCTCMNTLKSSGLIFGFIYMYKVQTPKVQSLDSNSLCCVLNIDLYLDTPHSRNITIGTLLVYIGTQLWLLQFLLSLKLCQSDYKFKLLVKLQVQQLQVRPQFQASGQAASSTVANQAAISNFWSSCKFNSCKPSRNFKLLVKLQVQQMQSKPLFQTFGQAASLTVASQAANCYFF